MNKEQLLKLDSSKPDNLYLYLCELYIDDKVFLKVGISKNVSLRYSKKGIKSKELFKKEMNKHDARIWEQIIMKSFKNRKHWIDEPSFEGYTECFKESSKNTLIKFMKKI